MTEQQVSPALIYARISQDRTGAGLGIDRQVADCRALAERLGWSVTGVHSDNDVSAYSGKPRPGYRALLDDLREGRAGRVLVWHTDRLHRSPVELEEYIDVCKPRGIATHTVQAGMLDLSTASGQMVARMLGNVARFESDHKGDRVRAARQQAAREGRYGGGKRPFGFEADGMTIRPDEAAEIVAATDALLAGAGLRGLVRQLNERGIPTTFGANAWTSQAFRDVLMRPRNAGLAVYRGEVIGPAKWPAVVPEDRWRAVVELLRDPGRRTSPAEAGVKWLGSGLYVCGMCGQPRLRVSSTGQKAPAYRCASREWTPGGSGHVTRKAAPVDEYVELLIVERLTRPDAADLLRPMDVGDGPDSGQLHAEAVAVRQRLDQLADAHAEGAVTLSQLTRGTAKMRARLAEIDAQLAAAVRVDPLVGWAGASDVRSRWAKLDLTRRRTILAVLMTVTILPSTGKWGPNGSRFDPDGVLIEWIR